jgi:aspartate carbamoyltransferase catalytic subunit
MIYSQDFILVPHLSENGAVNIFFSESTKYSFVSKGTTSILGFSVIFHFPHNAGFTKSDSLALGITCFPVYFYSITLRHNDKEAYPRRNKLVFLSVLVSVWVPFSEELKIILFHQQNVI